MSLELMAPENQKLALRFLEEAHLVPRGAHILH
jgi:hypothetical protein